MNGGDNSLIGGLISATTLVVLNYGVGKLVANSRAVERLVDGRPQILVRDGVLFERTLQDAGITLEELRGALRQNGEAHVAAVHLAILETNGSISVLPHRRHGSEQPAPRATGDSIRE